MKRNGHGRPRPTDIVCTIGPACRSRKKIQDLINAGMSVARLHFSYGSHREQAENIQRIREVSRKLRRPVKILQDLAGAKVRLAGFAQGSVEIKKGAIFTLTSRQVAGGPSIASVTIPQLIPVIKAGDTVLLSDGAIEMRAISNSGMDLACKVIVGGRAKSQAAVHVPGKAAPVRVPTLKDLNDVKFGIDHGVDWIAQSYATSAEEICNVRSFIQRQGAKTLVVAKIERREALAHLDEIIESADLVMVARGDLGMEIPLEEIVLAQKRIIAHARRLGKPVITATEMLFSMMERNKPTRAEVSDVTNAILDGSDAVMLSGETAVGQFPVQATQMLTRIAQVTNASSKRRLD